MEEKRSFLPSRQFALVAGATLIVVALVLTARAYGLDQAKNTYENKVAVTAKPNTPNTLGETDTDGDGVKDWEETLWGTDPKNQNTFNFDGGDASYIADLRQNIELPKAEQVVFSPPQEPTTETARFARQLFTRYLAIKNAGLEITPDTAGGFVSSFVTNLVSSPLPTKTYTLEDLRITDDTPEAYKTYSELLDSVLNIYQGNAGIDEIAELQNIAGNPTDQETIERLRIAWQQYEDVLSKTAILPVPESAAVNHLEVLNALALLTSYVRQFQYIASDPVAALPAISNYSVQLESFYQKLAALSGVIEKNL